MILEVGAGAGLGFAAANDVLFARVIEMRIWNEDQGGYPVLAYLISIRHQQLVWL